MTAVQTRIQGIARCRLRPGEISVDLFAGGGGASRGIELATGISPAIAINHDPHAIQMHEKNHPDTLHYCQSVYHREVHPRTLCTGYRVGLLWLSPDCRHFSRAKGSAPVSDSVRSLAWIGLCWAKHARPRIVVLENVPEFVTWGPLLPDGTPNKARRGETFGAFIREWKRYGYHVEWRTLVAADHDTPTNRKRLFLVARCDGEPIAWPEPTHGKSGKPRPWRAAAECIDWSDLGGSIFERKKPLAPATCRRIARGIVRYVLTAAKPFIVRIGQQGGNGDYSNAADQPITTITSKNEHLVVSPFVSPLTHGRDEFRGRSMDEPMPTITGAHRGEEALIAPTLIHTGNGEREGQAPRCQDIREPMGTVVAQRSNGAIAAASLIRMHHGEKQWGAADEPLTTVCAGANHHALVAAFLAKQIGARHGRGDQPLDTPMATLLTTERMALVSAFLVQYYSTGTQDQSLDEPLATIVSRARHGLVTVMIDGSECAIVDIRMRMLQPRELARAQGFEDSYELTGTKSQQIARIGNSVCPPLARAVVAAQLDEQSQPAKRRGKTVVALR
jgi:DNA (cytosine-5)-methyltransferase 1